jgi:alkylation response protein AidB-like acyl-CoA dehydrogenase
MLRDSAQRFFAGSDSVRSLRRLRDSRDLTGIAHGTWNGIVELGLSGVLIPEQFGGSGLDTMASIQISEMMGASLATGPFLSSAVMSSTILLACNNDRIKNDILPAIASGSIVTLASEETSRHNPLSISATVGNQNGRYVLSGNKIAVIDGNIAEKLIVPAKSTDNGQVLLLLVNSDANGIVTKVGMGIDSHPVVEIAFSNVALGPENVISDDERSIDYLDKAFDIGRIHLAAEMLGAAQEAFDRTVDYLKTRVQFGRKIGEFQALQHRAALLFGELEIARSLVLKSASIYDTDQARSAEFASLAKARVGEIAKHVTTEAVQLHGGIGVTDDFDIGLFLKRVKVASERLGDTSFHAERYAGLQGL